MECTGQEKNTYQATQRTKKSTTEKKDISPEAMDQSIRVLSTVPLAHNRNNIKVVCDQN